MPALGKRIFEDGTAFHDDPEVLFRSGHYRNVLERVTLHDQKVGEGAGLDDADLGVGIGVARARHGPKLAVLRCDLAQDLCIENHGVRAFANTSSPKCLFLLWFPGVDIVGVTGSIPVPPTIII